MLPFRSALSMRTDVLPILYIEEAWNDGNPWTFISENLEGKAYSPKLCDVAFFPGEKSATRIFNELKRKTNAIPVVHDFFDLRKDDSNFDNRTRLEVSPGLWASPQKIVNMISKERYGKILVLDTWHLRRSPTVDERATVFSLNRDSCLGDWEEAIELLLPYISLIHISPKRDDNNKELIDFMAGNHTELGEMIKLILKLGYTGPVMVEASLGTEGAFHPERIKVMLRLIYGTLRYAF
jgi:hypothetical protein